MALFDNILLLSQRSALTCYAQSKAPDALLLANRTNTFMMLTAQSSHLPVREVLLERHAIGVYLHSARARPRARTSLVAAVRCN